MIMRNYEWMNSSPAGPSLHLRVHSSIRTCDGIGSFFSLMPTYFGGFFSPVVSSTPDL